MLIQVLNSFAYGLLGNPMINSKVADADSCIILEKFCLSEWRRWELNPRPQECHSCALPAELRPLLYLRHPNYIAPPILCIIDSNGINNATTMNPITTAMNIISTGSIIPVKAVTAASISSS